MQGNGTIYILLKAPHPANKYLKSTQSSNSHQTLTHQPTNQPPNLINMYTSALLLAALPVVFAQYGDSDSGSDSTSSSSVAATTTASATSGIATVTVGQGGNLAFSPNSLTAAVGSVVEFQFYPKTHSVAQAAFATPCEPLANNTGFFSGGFQTTGTVNETVFAITINDTKRRSSHSNNKNRC